MLAHEFIPKIEAGAIPPVVVVGPGKAPFNREAFEPFLADRIADRIAAVCVPPEVRDLAYSVFHADETRVGDIVAEAQTMPFLAERRVIVVRNADRYFGSPGEKDSVLKPLIAYMEDPSETTILVLLTSKTDKRRKSYKTCSEKALIVECPQLDDNEMAKWIQGEAAALGKKIDTAAINELVSRAGYRLGDVHNALNLVANYLGQSNDRIREEDVITACADVAEESVWALTDAIAASDMDKALKTLHQLMDFGKSHDEIMGLINWLLESAYCASPDTRREIKSQFVGRKVMPLVNKLGLEKLKTALQLCTDTHFMLRSTGVDRDLALEMLVIKLAAPRKRPVRGAR